MFKADDVNASPSFEPSNAASAYIDLVRVLVEESPIGIFVVDADLQLAHVSRSAQTLLQLASPSPGRNLSEVLRSIWPEPFASEMIGKVQRTLASEAPFNSTSIAWDPLDVTGAGNHHWRIARITMPDGRHAVVCQFRNPPERLNQEAAVVDSELRFRRVFDNAGVALWEADLSLLTTQLDKLRSLGVEDPATFTDLGIELISRVRIKDVNAEAVRMFGATDAKQLLSALHATGTSDFASSITRELFSLWDGGNPHTGQARLNRLDGAPLDVQFKIVFAGKRGEHSLVTLLDITERKRAEDALRMSEERFRGIFDHAATGISITDLGSRFITCNPAYCTILGYTEQDLRSMSKGDLIHADDREEHLRQLERLRNGEIDSFEIVNRSIRKTGEAVWLHKHVSVLRDANGSPINHISLVTDMTEQRRSVERQRMLMRELAHRGKNLLAVVQSIAGRSFTSDLNLEDARHAFIGRLQALARSYATLTNDVFEGALLENVVRGELESFAGRVDISGPPIRLTPNATQTMALIVHELATNAAKYGALSSECGELEIEWRIEDSDDERRLEFSWIEVGSRPSSPTHPDGFGTTLITQVAGAEFGCTPDVTYDEGGFTYRLNANLNRIGTEIKDTPVRAMICNAQMRLLFDAWSEHRRAASIPPSFAYFDEVACTALGSVTIARVGFDETIEFIEVGSPLNAGIDARISDYKLGSDDSEGLAAAFRRCVRATGPCYERLSIDIAPGDAVMCERLIVPFSDGGTRVTRLVGLDAFSKSSPHRSLVGRLPSTEVMPQDNRSELPGTSNRHAASAELHALDLAVRIETLSSEELDALPYAAIRLDSSGVVRGYNKYAADHAGLDRKPVIGHPLAGDDTYFKSSGFYREQIRRFRNSQASSLSFAFLGDFGDERLEAQVRVVPATDGGLWILQKCDGL